MQHYGAPTRLLDWSANPLIALYFAVEKVIRDDPGVNGPNSTVWALNPWWLNASLRFGSKRTQVEGPLLPDWHEAGRYLRDLERAFETDTNTSQRLPAAIEPPHIDVRLAAQASRFVIFGQNRDLSSIHAVRRHDCQLIKLVVARKARVKILRELDDMGIKESTVFPDLAGLCTDLCRKWSS